jgi:hypothetical protein
MSTKHTAAFTTFGVHKKRRRKSCGLFSGFPAWSQMDSDQISESARLIWNRSIRQLLQSPLSLIHRQSK